MNDARPPMPTGRLVAIVVGVIFVIAFLTIGGLAVAGYVFAKRIHVTETRDEQGREKTLQVETPLGRLRVDQGDRVDPKLLNIPLYPGAVALEPRHGARVDVDLDFADKRLRVLAVEMETPDEVEKVIEFYREAAADFVFSKKDHGRVQFRWEHGNLQKIVGIVEKGGKTRISLAHIGEPEAN